MRYGPTLALCVLLSAFSLPQIACAQDFTLLGGDLTSDLKGRNSIQLPAPNISKDERRLRQISGFDVFHNLFSEKKGLGPQFNNRSCGSCHVNNGRGPVGFSDETAFGNAMVVRVSLKGKDKDGSPKDVPGIGEELLEQTLKNNSRFEILLSWKNLNRKYPDGTKYTLRSPILKFRLNTRSKVFHTLLMTPPLIGVGLLDAVSEDTILQASDPLDLNRDGISGRPNLVPDKRKEGKSIGRFGFKASEPSLEQQSAAALFRDIGISNSLFNKGPVEISDDELDRLLVYQAIAGVPKARDQVSPEVQQGYSLFLKSGCQSCHLPTLTTTNTKDERANQVIHPFTDLLLHDMGQGLASLRGEYDATGSEWKTAPLWGVGYGRQISRVEQRFLHDGRARTLEEAIVWHDGEARGARRKFMQLSAEDRARLIRFLDSL